MWLGEGASCALSAATPSSHTNPWSLVHCHLRVQLTVAARAALRRPRPRPALRLRPRVLWNALQPPGGFAWRCAACTLWDAVRAVPVLYASAACFPEAAWLPFTAEGSWTCLCVCVC